MKAVILAAGRGSRLGFTELPKPLTPLAHGKTILGYQLELLKKYFLVSDIIAVVGYHEEKIRVAHPEISYVSNPDYAVENTSKSLLKALSQIEDDVLWINGDVVLHAAALRKMMESSGNRMVVNAGPVGEEEVKYRSDGKGRILEVSKVVVLPEGEALGLNFICKQDLAAFRQELGLCAVNDYFEKGVEQIIQKGIVFKTVVVGSDFCTEVDFPQDLVKANQLIMSWIESGRE